MARKLKEIIVSEFQRDFAGMHGCVLIDYQGLDAEQTADLRGSLRESGVRMRVIHNRLVKRAFGGREEIPASFTELLRGPTAVLYGEDGPLAASKLLAGWQKKNKNLAAPKGGLLEGKVLSAEDVVKLSKIPDRPALQAQGAALFLSPLAVLASGARQLVSHFAGCVKARHDELAE